MFVCALLIVKSALQFCCQFKKKETKKRTQTHRPKRSAPRSCYSGSRLRQCGASWTLFTVTICTTEGPLALEAGCWGIGGSWHRNKQPIRRRWCSKKRSKTIDASYHCWVCFDSSSLLVGLTKLTIGSELY